MKLVALSGKMGSGKTTLADHLVDHFLDRNPYEPTRRGEPASVFSFAAPVKRFCHDVLGLTRKQCWGTTQDKATLTRYRWEDLPHYPRLCHAVTLRNRAQYLDKGETGWIHEKVPEGHMTARQIFQEFGTGVGRQFHPDVWVETLFRAVDNAGVELAVIDDCRFLSESKAIQARGGVVVGLTRVTAQDGHVSETGVDEVRKTADAVLDNAGMTLDESKNKLVRMLANLGVL